MIMLGQNNDNNYGFGHFKMVMIIILFLLSVVIFSEPYQCEGFCCCCPWCPTVPPDVEVHIKLVVNKPQYLTFPRKI